MFRVLLIGTFLRDCLSFTLVVVNAWAMSSDLGHLTRRVQLASAPLRFFLSGGVGGLGEILSPVRSFTLLLSFPESRIKYEHGVWVSGSMSEAG